MEAITVTSMEELSELITDEMEAKEFKNFEIQARFKGHGVYFWGSIEAADTRDLFLLGVASRNNIICNFD